MALRLSKPFTNSLAALDLVKTIDGLDYIIDEMCPCTDYVPLDEAAGALHELQELLQSVLRCIDE